jgi:hypothetical protein
MIFIIFSIIMLILFISTFIYIVHSTKKEKTFFKELKNWKTEGYFYLFMSMVFLTFFISFLFFIFFN